MNIRLEKPDDYVAVERLTYEAFLSLDFPGRRRMDEHYLIWLLKGSKSVIPELCFVAEQGGEVVGHILYTRNKIKGADGSEKDGITFGPLSVLPKYQKQGIGSALVFHSLEKAREMGFGAVLITGIPEYYPKIGFKRARDYGLTLEDGTAEDSFMVFELVTGYLEGGGVLHFSAPEYALAENDDEGYYAFHKRFMAGYLNMEIGG
ncbi:MAG: N-acetyltransferase [Clostridiales Family XIII bacterium]|nr:N-acetyltransferase [Clostridiales Family XIII bacterium]